jgi:hypothetical protein
MKKRTLSLFAILPFLTLVSCGTPSATALPNKGTVVDSTLGKQKLQESVVSMDTSDALGVSVNDAFVDLSYEADESYTVGNLASSSTSMKGNFKLEKGTAAVGVSGLTGTKAADFKASATVSADISGKTTTTTGSTTNSSMLNSGSYAGAFYAADNKGYLDTTNANLHSAITTVMVSVNSSFAEIPTKAVFPLGLKDEMFPIVSKETMNKYYDSIVSAIQDIDTDGKGAYRDHGNGTYSYSITITGEDIEKAIDEGKKTITNTSASTGSELTGSAASASFLSSFDGTYSGSLSFSLIYDTTGIVSVGFSSDLSVSFSSSMNISGLASPDFSSMTSSSSTIDAKASFSGKASLKTGVKVSFLKGDKVTVASVPDPDAYTAFSLSD